MDSDAGWSPLQRAGFAVVLVVAVATVGYATVMGPSDPHVSGVGVASDVHDVAATTRVDRDLDGFPLLMIDGCGVEPRAHCPRRRWTGANLRGVDLEGAFLLGTHMNSANLSEANLSRANLMEAHLRSANLRGTVLEGALLQRAELRNADLRNANLRSTVLRGAVLRDADLRDADLRGANLWGVDLDNTTMPDGSRCTTDKWGYSYVAPGSCSWKP